MRTILVSGKGVNAKAREALKPIRKEIDEIESDYTTFLFTVTKYDSYSEKVKAAKTLMELDYIYGDNDLVNDPELINEFKKVAESIKTINEFATTRAYKKQKAYQERRKNKGN